jgi:hypothetical protein
MPTVVILLPSGEKKAIESKDTEYTPQLVAKLLKKKKVPEQIGAYPYGDLVLTLWSWKEGKAGTENKHELPPPHDGLLFGDIVVTAGEEDVTPEIWDAFYAEIFAFEDLEEGEDEVEVEVDEVEVDEEVDEEADEVEVEGEAEGEGEGDAEAEAEVEEAEDLEEDEIDADDDCYDDGDEAGGGSKRRAPRKKTAQSAELRRIDMGLRSKIKLPTIVGKRAPKWQTEDEITEEAYA